MPTRDEAEPKTLDELVSGKLPEHVLESLKEMTLTVEEVNEWSKSRPNFSMKKKGRYLHIDLRMRIPINKLLACIGGLIGTFGTALWLTLKLLEKLR